MCSLGRYADDAQKDDMLANPALRLSQAFPATKIMFLPNVSTAEMDMVVTSSDGLRLWKLEEERASLDRFLDVRIPSCLVIYSQAVPSCQCAGWFVLLTQLRLPHASEALSLYVGPGCHFPLSVCSSPVY